MHLSATDLINFRLTYRAFPHSLLGAMILDRSGFRRCRTIRRRRATSNPSKVLWATRRSPTPSRTPRWPGRCRTCWGGLLALLRGALTGKDADDQLRVDLQSEAADLSSETTLSDLNSAVGNQGDVAETNTANSASALAFLKGVVDRLGGTLTVTDEGALAINSLPSIPAGSNNIGSVDVASLPSVTIGSQTAGLAQDSTVSSLETAVRDKEHYSDVLTGGQITLGSALSKTADGFEVLTSGTVEVNTTSGTTRQFSASPGRIYPIGVTQFTGNTGLAASDLLAWIR